MLTRALVAALLVHVVAADTRLATNVVVDDYLRVGGDELVVANLTVDESMNVGGTLFTSVVDADTQTLFQAGGTQVMRTRADGLRVFLPATFSESITTFIGTYSPFVVATNVTADVILAGAPDLEFIDNMGTTRMTLSATGLDVADTLTCAAVEASTAVTTPVVNNPDGILALQFENATMVAVGDFVVNVFADIDMDDNVLTTTGKVSTPYVDNPAGTLRMQHAGTTKLQTSATGLVVHGKIEFVSGFVIDVQDIVPLLFQEMGVTVLAIDSSAATFSMPIIATEIGTDSGDGALRLKHETAIVAATTATGIDITGTLAASTAVTTPIVNNPDGELVLQYINAPKLEVISTGIRVTGSVTTSKITSGLSSTIQFQSGTTTRMTIGSSFTTYVDALYGDSIGTFLSGGSFSILHENVAKLTTASTGVAVTGTLAASTAVTTPIVNNPSGGVAFQTAGVTRMTMTDTDITTTVPIVSSTVETATIRAISGTLNFFGAAFDMTLDATRLLLSVALQIVSAPFIHYADISTSNSYHYKDTRVISGGNSANDYSLWQVTYTSGTVAAEITVRVLGDRAGFGAGATKAVYYARWGAGSLTSLVLETFTEGPDVDTFPFAEVRTSGNNLVIGSGTEGSGTWDATYFVDVYVGDGDPTPDVVVSRL